MFPSVSRATNMPEPGLETFGHRPVEVLPVALICTVATNQDMNRPPVSPRQPGDRSLSRNGSANS